MAYRVPQVISLQTRTNILNLITLFQPFVHLTNLPFNISDLSIMPLKLEFRGNKSYQRELKKNCRLTSHYRIFTPLSCSQETHCLWSYLTSIAAWLWVWCWRKTSSHWTAAIASQDMWPFSSLHHKHDFHHIAYPLVTPNHCHPNAWHQQFTWPPYFSLNTSHGWFNLIFQYSFLLLPP